MTAHRDLKQIIRARQEKTGESYTIARAHVMRARSERLGLSTEAPARLDIAQRFEAVVLKVNRQSARVRILGEDGQLTFRSSDAWSVVPGHVVTLLLEKRWTWQGDAYASGRIDNQGVRFCWEDVRHGRTWEEMQEREEAARDERRGDLH